MTVGEWIREARPRLEQMGAESPAMEAQLLAAHVLRADRSFVLAHPETVFPELAGEHLLQRREAHEPLAYILGRREFYGRVFRVGPGVLIPRHETETLVDAALSFLEAGHRVLDLGTGSGCIAVTLKLERPGLEVTASDISDKALEIASTNAEELGAAVRFVRSDGFRELLGESFDLIVSNPPYVGQREILPPEVRDHEPSEALFAGETGLEFYESLASSAAEYLRDRGRLMVEVGYRQAHEVALIFEAQGWTVEDVRKDLSGTDRIIVVRPVFACA
jgi:release factor glutamine methyltransferase